MINTEIARDYIWRAKRYLAEAERVLNESDFSTTVRRSQKALELSAKAVLRYLAIEYPREHDVGEALGEIQERLPSELRNRLPRMKSLLPELARARGPAMYGLEREGVPASKAFGEEYATEILAEVKELVDLSSKSIEGEKERE